MMVMHTLHGLHLLLQRGQRGLRLADITRLQGGADLAQCLCEGTVRVAAGSLRQARANALRSLKVAGLQGVGQLPEGLPQRIDRRRYVGRGGRNRSYCHDTSPAGPNCPAWNRVARAHGLADGHCRIVKDKSLAIVRAIFYARFTRRHAPSASTPHGPRASQGAVHHIGVHGPEPGMTECARQYAANLEAAVLP